MWIKSADCANIIKQNWDADLGLMANLSNCKLGLMSWNKTQFGQVNKRIVDFQKMLAINFRSQLRGKHIYIKQNWRWKENGIEKKSCGNRGQEPSG